MVDLDSINFYYDSMCLQQADLEDLQLDRILVKELYVRYAPKCLENRLCFFGWCKNQRLPNGVFSASDYFSLQTKIFTPMVKDISTCKNATMITFENGGLVVCGKIKGEADNEQYEVISFGVQVKLISAGRMTLAAVLSTNEVVLHGYNKDGDHFQGTSHHNIDSWNVVKIDGALEALDDIVDLASGTHFTLFVTKKGYLYGTGKRFLSIFGMENNGSF